MKSTDFWKSYKVLHVETGASIEEATYARGLVALNKINMDRIAHLWWGIMVIADSLIYVIFTRTDPRAAVRPAEGPNSFHWKNRDVGSFILLHKISRTACCFGICTFLKQYNCYKTATIWYTDHQYIAQNSEIINHLQEIPLIFCNYAVCSCGTGKGPGQSPRNVLSISDLELYVTETSTGVCDPITD